MRLSLAALLILARLAWAQEDPLLARARVAVNEYGSGLPDYVCQESIERFTISGLGQRSRVVQLDTVTAEVVYERGKESFRNLRVNDKPVAQPTGGIWSVGFFGPMMLSLFDPRIPAEFRRRGTSREAGRSAVRYEFEVTADKSNWQLTGEGINLKTAYRGSIWVEASTGRILRHEIVALDLPSKFYYSGGSMKVHYGAVQINGREYLLPRTTESSMCPRNAFACERNIAQYSGCHKFGAESTLTFDEE